MKIVVAAPNQYAKTLETEDVEKAIAKVIGGGTFDLAPFPKDKDVSIVMGTMHQQMKLAPNRLIDNVEEPFPVFGPLVLCQKQDGKYTGLTDEQAEKFEKRYHQPEQCYANPILKIMVWEPYDPTDTPTKPEQKAPKKSRGQER